MPAKNAVKRKLIPPMITMPVSVLKEALKAVAWVIEPRNTMPVCGNVKLVSDKGRLILTGTDVDTYVSATIDVEGKSAICMMINAKTLKAILDSCDPAETLSLAISNDGRAGIGFGDGAEIEMETMPAGDYPRLNYQDDAIGATMEISALQFAELVDRVSFAISHEAARYYLNGTCWETFESSFRMVAADGHKLAFYAQIPAKMSGDFKRLIVPTRPLSGIRKLLGGKIIEGEMLRFTVIHNGKPEAAPIVLICEFVDKGITLTTKLIDGSFPDYPRVVNKEGVTGTITLKRQELSAILNRVVKISDGRLSPRATFEIAGKAHRRTLTMTSYNTMLGTKLRMKLPAAFTGETEKFDMNASYMLAALRSFKNEDVRLDMITPVEPILLYDLGNSDGYAVVMPMRV